MNIRLIALAVIALGACAELTAEISKGAAFEVSPEAAEPLLTAGLAKLESEPLAPATRTKSVKARVLMACPHGQPDDVVTLALDIAKEAEANGQVDTNKAAVAYALTLDQNKA